MDEIPCPQSGEPFYGQDAQYVLNHQSYTKLDAGGNDLPDDAPWPWAMVRDNVTGLIWEVKTGDGTIHDGNILFTWERAMEFGTTLNSQNYGGYCDWRLPTAKELLSIVNRSTYPQINTSYFPNTKPYKYWASPVTPDIPLYKWVVYFSSGAVRSTYHNSGHVRAVRGEPSTNIFFENNDGTVTDTQTGLMWQQNTAPGTYAWQEALSYCENLTLAGHDDWRLPDINELQSIIDYARYDPAIDTAYFPNTMADDYWSSTPDALENQGWGIRLDDGGMRMLALSLSYYVRAVRGGKCGSLGDSDGDTVCDNADNCPNDHNPHQEDADGDGTGNACDECTDTDGDGFGNPSFSGNICEADNCPNSPNGNILGTCSKVTGGVVIGTGVTCLSYEDCQEDEYCDMVQGDCNNNGIGDACECYADVNCSTKVDLSDLVIMKGEFLQSCPCQADCNGDNQVNLGDSVIMKTQFLRTNCPACP